MEYCLPNSETLAFIREHRSEDVRTLALKYAKADGVDLRMALMQIDGWQRARHKLPSWAEKEDVVYPPHLSMEQCSGEVTALYKQNLCSGEAMADLTGGFGVDFSFLSRRFKRAVYVERQENLCEIARHNFSAMGYDNVSVWCGEAEQFLDEIAKNGTLQPLDLIYIDPARRDDNGHKTYAISDCTPDVTVLLPQLLSLARRIVIKLSPMLDHNAAARALSHVTEIHILSAKNECKETLLVIDSDAESAPEEVRLMCVNDENVFQTVAFAGTPVPVIDDADLSVLLSAITSGVDIKLFVPNASVMKAGCFGALCQAYGLVALDVNTHLFVRKNAGLIAENAGSPDNICLSDFPGRQYSIRAVSTFNKKELRTALSGIDRACIATRNFPMQPEELRRKLRSTVSLKDGGDTYIIGTTILGKKTIVVTTQC